MTDKKQLLLWISALVLGAVLGLLQQDWINELADFVAAVYTRLFQVLAAPTIALAIITTLSTLGMQKDTGRIFRHTITYTLLTTVCSALVGLVLFLFVRPDSLPEQIVNSGVVAGIEGVKPESSVYDHILSVIPTNMVQPFLAGNVLSILLLAAAVGVGLSAMKESEAKKTLVNMVNGLQDLMFILIKALIRTLPLGIVAFAAQLTAAPIEGLGGALGKYVLVILGGNLVQFFLILPLFLLARGLNPLYILMYVTCSFDGILHKIECCDPTCYHTVGRTEPQCQSESLTFRIANLHYNQYERLCSIHSRHVALCDAEWRIHIFRPAFTDIIADSSVVAVDCRDFGNRQCGCSDGLLLPDLLSDVGYWGSFEHNGHHFASIHGY